MLCTQHSLFQELLFWNWRTWLGGAVESIPADTGWSHGTPWTSHLHRCANTFTFFKRSIFSLHVWKAPSLVTPYESGSVHVRFLSVACKCSQWTHLHVICTWSYPVSVNTVLLYITICALLNQEILLRLRCHLNDCEPVGGKGTQRYVLLYLLYITVDTAIVNTTGSGLLTWGTTDMLLHCWAHGFPGLCTETHKTAGVSKCFFTSLNSWEWQGAVCSLQWPLDDRATLRAIHSLISPCPLLQKGLSSIKVKINGWKRDSKSLLWVRGCLLCGQGNCNQAEQKTNPDFSWWVFHWSVLQKVTQHPASRWHYWIILTQKHKQTFVSCSTDVSY